MPKMYNVILADPPWKYANDMHTGHRSTDHYPGWDVWGNEINKFDSEVDSNG